MQELHQTTPIKKTYPLPLPRWKQLSVSVALLRINMFVLDPCFHLTKTLIEMYEMKLERRNYMVNSKQRMSIIKEDEIFKMKETNECCKSCKH